MTLLALLLFTLGPEPAVVRERVDRIETNHVYDLDGKHLFSQRLHWCWNARDSRYQIESWRLVRDPNLTPINNTLLWLDEGVIRKLVATEVRESWTQWDEEYLDQELHPKQNRRELRKPIIRK